MEKVTAFYYSCNLCRLIRNVDWSKESKCERGDRGNRRLTNKRSTLGSRSSGLHSVDNLPLLSVSKIISLETSPLSKMEVIRLKGFLIENKTAGPDGLSPTSKDNGMLTSKSL